MCALRKKADLVGKLFTGMFAVDAAKETGKNMAKEWKTANNNRYNAVLGNKAVKPQETVRSQRYPGNSTIGPAPIVKAASIEYVNGQDGSEPANEGRKRMKYVVPAALLIAAGARARQTGDSLQLYNDAADVFRKEKFNYKNVRKSYSNEYKNIQKKVKERDKQKESAFASQLKQGAGLTLGATAVAAGVEAAKNISEQKKYENARNYVPVDRAAFYIEDPGLIDDKKKIIKTAAEIKGAKGYAEKVMREGILQPSINAFPIYATPVAISYLLNKDIKGDLGPVRDLSKREKQRKQRRRAEIDSDVSDFRSRNNAVINTVVLADAKERGIQKVASSVSGNKWRVKDWSEFASELPINGLRAAAIAAPISILVQKDPTAKYKHKTMEYEQEMRDEEMYERMLDLIKENQKRSEKSRKRQ